ncbi:MAG TPA: DNA-processing protein DprA [Spirochaetota bacterium]|nr:DNA-processing protein DprA [Spirochaetota bacterium]
MTNDLTLSAVYLSILSSQARLGLYDRLWSDPREIKSQLNKSQCIIQDHIAEIYGRDPLRASEMILERCYKKNISVIALPDERYPTLLREIHRPPFIIYARGEISNGRMISIVGTRNSDRLSEEITLKLSSTLSAAGYCIVSGMAYGIDRFAHLGALKSGGRTIGVLPGGIDSIYPYRNRDIYSMIASSEGSSVISEYPPDIKSGQKWTFARRNRIISGISPAVVVVQAPRGSGAMITARYAIEQNREVFVCPGHAFDDNYEGCHDLIRDGAAIVSRVEDILSVIEPGYGGLIDYSGKDESDNAVESAVIHIKPESVSSAEQKSADFSRYSGIERELLESIASGNADIDSFTRNSSYSPDAVLGAITVLEIEGIITRKGNNLLLK